MTHLLKATIAGLVLASPFAVARDYNGGDNDGAGIAINLTIKGGIVNEGITSTGTIAATTAAVAGMQKIQHNLLTAYEVKFQEAGDKLGLQAGGDIAFSMDLDNDMSASVFLEVLMGRTDSKTVGGFDETAKEVADTAVTLDHKLSYAPGVMFNYGCLGVGVKYSMSEFDYTIGTAAAKTAKGKDFYLGVSGKSSFELDDMGDLSFGFQAWSTIGNSAETEVKDFVKALNDNNTANAPTDSFFNSTQIFLTLGLNVTNV